jgi:glycosyltransferase involved in cell wall biosynthesis
MRPSFQAAAAEVWPSSEPAPVTPIRVAMVVASPFPANHGTPGSISEMADAIADAGHQVHLVTYHFGEGEASGRIRLHRIAAPRLRPRMVVGPTRDKPLLDLLMLRTLVGVIRRERIDVIHAHNYEGALIGSAARLLTGKPLVYNAINTMSDELPSYGFIRPRFLAVGLARLLDWMVPRLADRVIAISDDLGRFLLAGGLGADRVEVIPLGIDPRRFAGLDRDAARRRLGLGSEPLVMYTGILARMQRLDYLFQAMRQVVAKRPDARLLLVVNCASAAEIQACEREMAGNGLAGKARILLAPTFDELPGILAAADVTVVPRPHCPGFPVKLLNYMAAGKPTVCFAGSAKGLEHRRTGWVVPDHDVDGLAAGILALVEDEDLARTLGENGRRRAQEVYAWPRLTERTVDVYRQLLAGAAGRERDAAREATT